MYDTKKKKNGKKVVFRTQMRHQKKTKKQKKTLQFECMTPKKN